MPNPYPENKTLKKQIKSDLQYQQAREDYATNEADLQTEAEAFGEEREAEEETERRARLEEDLNDSLRKTNTEIMKEQQKL